MLRIGDFARLGQVSVVTLRHYDDIGLLKPGAIGEENGYRYYAVSQLAQLNRILALKDLGFSLEQTGSILDGVTLEQLQGMLKVRQAEAQQQIATESERLVRIAARLKEIELEETMPNYDVILKNAPAAIVAARKVTIPTNDQVPAYLGAAFDETYKHVRDKGAKDSGPCIAIWHQGAEVLAEEVAEAVVPVDRAIAGSSNVSVYELPETLVASVIHQGPLANMTRAHAVILSWLEGSGYRSTGTYREVYIKHDPGDDSTSTTEIQYPVEKMAA